MERVTLVLPMAPSANRYWRHFTPKGHKRAITVLSDEAKAFKSEVAAIARQAGVSSVIRGRVGVAYTLIPQRPKDWAKRAKKDPEGWADSIRCIDLDNSLKVLMDSLNGVVIEDDKWARKFEIERGEPEDQARMVVTVYKIDLPESRQQGLGL
jgi:crossover junction endodeoxyribonuclease RusA